MQSMNGVLDAEPDPQAAFNLVLCTFALGDKEMMKQAFSRLVEVLHRLMCLSFMHLGVLLYHCVPHFGYILYYTAAQLCGRSYIIFAPLLQQICGTCCFVCLHIA